MTRILAVLGRGVPVVGLLAVTSACFDVQGEGEGEGEGAIAVVRGGDLVAAGGSVSRADSVPGDAILAGGDVEFEGWTGGDVLATGGALRIGGRVGGDVRAAGGEVRLEAQVARNVTMAGGDVEVASASVIDGNAYLAGGAVDVDGRVSGLLRVAGGEVAIRGSVGDVRVEADRLVIGSGAVISGDLRYRAGAEPEIDPGARILGETVALPPRPERRGLEGLKTLFRIVGWVGFLLAGAVVIALFPGTSRGAEEALRRRPWASLGLGLLWVVGVPVLCIVLAILFVGIPLALILCAVYLITLYLARAVVAIWIGRLVLRGPGASGAGPLVLRFLIGAVALFLVRLVPVLGVLVAIAATLIGLGAVAWAVGSRSTASEPAA